MLSESLLNPGRIVVVGASNDTGKPGGKVLFNLLSHGFRGKVYAVNQREQNVQGQITFASCEDLPEVELAIIAVAARYAEETIRVLALEKKCKAFILFSAGFGETGEEGRKLEEKCVAIVDQVGGTLIGPNCIGVITGSYKGVFAGPVPAYDPRGCDCVSESGATMVYILEMAIARGLKFSTMFSIGNSAQIGVEDVLEHWDETFDPEKSSKIKLLYMEKISDPARFLKHARSLYQKGCRLAAIKSGATAEGSRAVSSHTGSLSGSNVAVSALFRKAGVIRCSSRMELVYMAAIFTFAQLKGNRIAVITHAGGPGVMLTDELIRGGMRVPRLDGPKARALLSHLHPGSSVANPIDFLATGTASQLGTILDAVEHDFNQIDASVVVFGTTGMWRVDDVYKVLHDKMNAHKKPIFPILPSVIQAAEEVSMFNAMGHVNFTDEVSFAYTLSRVYRRPPPLPEANLPKLNKTEIRRVITHHGSGYLPPEAVQELLQLAGFDVAEQKTIYHRKDLRMAFQAIGFPLVMKVIGPLHKSDIGGVLTNIGNEAEGFGAFEQLSAIQGCEAVLLQAQHKGLEVFMGASREDPFGHTILCGLGGVFIEVFRDVSSALSPVSKKEGLAMIRRLKSYPLIKGSRGKEGMNEHLFAEALLKLSALLKCAPEIAEMDINPLMGRPDRLVAVDARIRIEH
ncbi:MAG TPA: acetate--CoA ligase family protein [Bacteroidia bacterium]|nr:acetate--CoA ligase family protein [Bacteroidia bacterium]